MPRRLTLLPLLFAASLPALAQEIGFQRYYQQNEFSLTSPGAMKYGLYGYDNPAGLHYLTQGDLTVNWTSDAFLYDDQRWNTTLAAPGVSFSFGRDNRGAGSVREYKLAFGGGTDASSGGLSIGWYGGDTDMQDLRTHFTLGSINRPNRYTSIGLTGTLATDTRYYEGVVDVAIRPFGNTSLSVFADYSLGNDDRFDDGRWSVGGASEVMPGIRLTGRYFDTGTITAGVQVSLGHTGFSAQSHQLDGGDPYQSYSVRAGGWDRNVFDAWSSEGDDVLELDLSDEMAYQTLGLFDRRRSLLDTLRYIDAARQDDNIAGIVVNTTRLQVPAAMAWEIKTALDEFRDSGKTVYLYIEEGGMTELLLSSAADEVILDPMGTLNVPGFVSGSTYLGELLAHWGIGVDELRNLEYKTAFESLSRSEMSAADRVQRQAMIDSFYQLWQSSMSEGRNLTPGAFNQLIDRGLSLTANDLLAMGVVDRLARYSELDDVLKDITGSEPNRIEPDGLQVLREPRDNQWGPAHRIAVVYATGMTATDSGMRTRELARSLRELREDDDIEAVVLRVDSPGGLILAADLLAQEVKLTQAEKPVVVSMGSLATSGGYWVSMHAGTLVASPNTITGSIGVTAVRLWDDGLGDRLRLNSESVSRGQSADANFGIGLPVAGLSLPDRDLSTEERMGIMRRLDGYYDAFVTQAAEARGVRVDEMRALAAGRVYSGSDALAAGLVDELGSLTHAIDLARKQAGIADNDKVFLVESPRPNVSSLQDLRYLMDVEGAEALVFNRNLYRQQYLRDLVEHRGQPLVLLPYHYFDGSLER
jgi:protease-4